MHDNDLQAADEVFVMESLCFMGTCVFTFGNLCSLMSYVFCLLFFILCQFVFGKALLKICTSKLYVAHYCLLKLLQVTISHFGMKVVLRQLDLVAFQATCGHLDHVFSV